MKRNVLMATSLALAGAVALGGATITAQTSTNTPCKELPTWSTLRDVLKGVQALGNDPVTGNGGFGLQMWGTLVNRDGIVCAVAFTGNDRGDQWPGSRVISAQKANTANAFGLPRVAISTANLYTAVQPGGSLFGLQESNPVSTDAAYAGNPANYGQANDPLVGTRVGGVNVFGGGLALYNSSGKLVGGLGVSGDTSCADHEIAWRTRAGLNLDYLVAGGVFGFAELARRDNIIYDITPQAGQMPGVSAGGWGHPTCYNTADQTKLPITN
jgi:uncharacterized protein GlcG (DUF336 family)